MPGPSRNTAIREIGLGFRILRAAAVLPATTVQTPYFTVAGGLVMITSFIGIVTTLFDATATTLKFVANPTTGTDVDMCAASASTANKEVGGLFSIDGAAITTALISTNAGNIGAMTKSIVVGIGTIDALTANTNVGACRWVCTYVPLDNGAYIVVA